MGFLGFVFFTIPQMTIAVPVAWVALVLTGQIQDRISGDDSPPDFKADAMAAIAVILITVPFVILGYFTGIPIFNLAATVVYYMLIYRAFQLDGFSDIFWFGVIHGLIWLPLIMTGAHRHFMLETWFG